MAVLGFFCLHLELSVFWNSRSQNQARTGAPIEFLRVERPIGTLQRECLDYRYEPMNSGGLQEVVDARPDKYRHYRPHESLGFLTPAEHSAVLGVPIPKRAGVIGVL